MEFTIDIIDHRIDELKELKKEHDTSIKKLKKQYATKEAIIDGPDRGYTYTKWHDDAAKEVYDKLHMEWYGVDSKINHLRQAKRHLTKAHDLLTEHL